jgi:glycosyltransferase involved in cell wall biosynthesis
MNRNAPLVSIGLPVYNGEKFLTKSLHSLLSQTFTDFELIISDNASTDRTEEICRNFVTCDPRIRYYRSRCNRGASWNHNRVFRLAKGKYFKWAACDDLCATDFLEKCIQVLESNPEVVLCFTKTKVIDKNGEFFESEEPYVKLTNANVQLKLNSLKPHERFGDLIGFPHSCYQFFGLIRSSALQSTPLLGRFAGSDRILLARLGLLGRFYEIPDYLFFLRRHSGQSIEICMKSMHLYNIWHDPSYEGKISFPYWRWVGEYIFAVHQSPLSWKTRLRCYAQIRHALFGHWQLWQRMQRDLTFAVLQILDAIVRKLFSIINSSPNSKEDLVLLLGRYPRLNNKNSQS